MSFAWELGRELNEVYLGSGFCQLLYNQNTPADQWPRWSSICRQHWRFFEKEMVPTSIYIYITYNTHIDYIHYPSNMEVPLGWPKILWKLFHCFLNFDILLLDLLVVSVLFLPGQLFRWKCFFKHLQVVYNVHVWGRSLARCENDHFWEHSYPNRMGCTLSRESR